MHTDEAVNAYIVGQLLAGEPFQYDPQDRHGPALSALALPLARMQGAKPSLISPNRNCAWHRSWPERDDSAVWRGGRDRSALSPA